MYFHDLTFLFLTGKLGIYVAVKSLSNKIYLLVSFYWVEYALLSANEVVVYDQHMNF